MDRIIIGNAVSLLGATLMVAVGFLKERRTILTIQCLQFGIMGVANFILGGITGAISALVSIVRNIVCQKRPLTVPLKLLFIVVQIFLSIGINTMGIIGWLPIISACFYTWMIDVKSETRLKAVIIIAQAMWLIFDFAIQNYVSFCFDIFTILSNFIGIVQLRKLR